MPLKKKSPFPLIAYTATAILTLLAVFLVFIDRLPVVRKPEPQGPVGTGAAIRNDVAAVPRETPAREELSVQPKKSIPQPPRSVPNNAVLIGDVPFTSQAPYMNWNDIVYEEWCEEASMLMAVYWARGKELTDTVANEEIKKISDFETQELWVFHDTSVYDTAKIMQKYFSFDRYKVMGDIGKNDIVQSLRNGNIVLVPAYGRDLHNKNYTPPGPIPHMLVIIGYDPAKKEFVTNDPGTKHGKWFRYNEDTLFNAIWTYPTSEKKPVPPGSAEKRKKSMIEISK